jgi:hypothetical protein
MKIFKPLAIAGSNKTLLVSLFTFIVGILFGLLIQYLVTAPYITTIELQLRDQQRQYEYHINQYHKPALKFEEWDRKW